MYCIQKFNGIYKYNRDSSTTENREKYKNCLFRIIGLWETILLYLNTTLFFSDQCIFFENDQICKTFCHLLHSSEDSQLKNVG